MEITRDIYLSIGSNLGDRIQNIEEAISRLSELDLEVIGVSSYFESEPWGDGEMQAFINNAVYLRSTMSGMELLRDLQKIESDLGRKKKQIRTFSEPIFYSDRIIDLDIIYYGDEQINTDQLTVPHPYRAKRKFVLLPLAELNPNFIDPIYQLPLSVLLEGCKDKGKVIKLV